MGEGPPELTLRIFQASPLPWGEGQGEGRYLRYVGAHRTAMTAELAVEQRHHARGVALARRSTPRSRGLQRSQFLPRQLDAQRPHILLQVAAPLCAGNWHYVRPLRQQPCQSDLPGRRALRAG